MKIRVRRATLDDMDSILPLMEKLHASAGFGECAPFVPEDVAVFTARLIANPKAECIVAEDDGELIGLSTFVVDSPYFNWSRKVASGISFWVEPEYRKTGVGKALYDTSEKLAIALGCKVITVGVMVGDDYLVAYHERNGFHKREILLHKVLE